MHEKLIHALKKKNGEALNVHFQKWFKARLKQDSFFEKGKHAFARGEKMSKSMLYDTKHALQHV